MPGRKRQRTAEDWDKLSPAYKQRMLRTVGKTGWIERGPSPTARGHTYDEVIVKYKMRERIKDFGKLDKQTQIAMAKNYDKGFINAGKFRNESPERKAEVIQARNDYLKQRQWLGGENFMRIEQQSYDEFRADYLMRFGR